MFDLNNLFAYREDNRLEAKLAGGGLPESLWETYAAFANTLGGVILLGVRELPDHTLEVAGVPNVSEQLQAFWRIINDRKRVSANILSDRDVYVLHMDGRAVIVIEVPQAPDRLVPVYLGENPLTGTYQRNGEGDYRCTADEIRRMQYADAAYEQPLHG